MTNFPTRENDVTQLAGHMESGYFSNPADFPHNGRGQVMTARLAHFAAWRASRNATGQVRITTRAKERSLADLVVCMKGLLKKAEADVSGDAVKLAWIGWGPKAEPKPLAAPGEPQYLTAKAIEGGYIELGWARPVGGGVVGDYLIEARRFVVGEGWTPWRLMASVYDNAATIKAPQPGTKMDFRVIAQNASGASLPSNSAEAVSK